MLQAERNRSVMQMGRESEMIIICQNCLQTLATGWDLPFQETNEKKKKKKMVLEQRQRNFLLRRKKLAKARSRASEFWERWATIFVLFTQISPDIINSETGNALKHVPKGLLTNEAIMVFPLRMENHGVWICFKAFPCPPNHPPVLYLQS